MDGEIRLDDGQIRCLSCGNERLTGMTYTPCHTCSNLVYWEMRYKTAKWFEPKYIYKQYLDRARKHHKESRRRNGLDAERWYIRIKQWIMRILH